MRGLLSLLIANFTLTVWLEIMVKQFLDPDTWFSQPQPVRIFFSAVAFGCLYASCYLFREWWRS